MSLEVNETQAVPLDKVPEECRINIMKARAFAAEFTQNPVQTQVQIGISVNAPAPQPLLSIQQTEQKSMMLGVLCRVYVGSIYFELSEQDVRAAFQPFGYIKSINMSYDPSTNKHKGYCFVEYDTAEGASLALECMNGSALGGRQIRVGRPNNYPSNLQSIGLPLPPPNRIYVSNVHPEITESNLQSVFEPIGKILSCSLIPDALTSQHKGYGYIEFDTEQSAEIAKQAMVSFNLGGLQVRVSSCVVGGDMPKGMSHMSSTHSIQQAIASRAASILPNFLASTTTRPALDESLNSEENATIRGNQRVELMHKLARGTGLEPSKVIVLRNMVTSDDIDPELETDIRDECGKYGQIESVYIHVEPEKPITDVSTNVKIFVKFTEGRDVLRAQTALNGRWFAGRMVKADVYEEQRYTRSDYSG